MMDILGIVIWPIVVLLLVIFGLLLFKTAIGNFIDRCSNLKLGPAALSSQQRLNESTKELLDIDTKHLFKEFDNPLVAKVEEAVKKDLQQRNIISYVEREGLLIRHYAVTALALYAERVYNLIWGSQLTLLQNLNSRGSWL